jgi:hypothetical protein
MKEQGVDLIDVSAGGVLPITGRAERVSGL